jgi:hypothetical protein
VRRRCDFIAHSDDLFFCVMARPYLSTLVTFLKQLKVELQDQIELEFGVFTAGAVRALLERRGRDPSHGTPPSRPHPRDPSGPTLVGSPH